MKNPTSQFRRLVAVVVLPMYLAACTSWQVQEVAPAQMLEEEQPTEVRVTRTDGSAFVLENPQVSGDTLSGVRDGLQMSISLSTVDAIAVRKSDTGKTIGVAFLSVVLVAGAVALIVYLDVCGRQNAC